MEVQDSCETSSDVKICSDLVIEEPDLAIGSTENVSQIQEVENSSEVYPNLESGSEVITIVTGGSEEEIYIYEEKNESNVENSSEYIQVCDSNNALPEDSDYHNKEEMIINVTDEEIDDSKENSDWKEAGENVNDHDKNVEIDAVTNDCGAMDEKASDGGLLKNFKSVILEDWEVEVPQVVENHETETCSQIEVSEEPQDALVTQTQEVLPHTNENGILEDNIVTTTEEKYIMLENVNTDQNSQQNLETSHENDINSISDKKIDSLKISKSITKDEIVKILDESTDRVVRPIVKGKDLFFSIELTKRLNQKLSLSKPSKNSETGNKTNSDSCNNNNTLDDRQKIVDILEADEIKDWKSVPAKSDFSAKENGNDMEITKAIKNLEEGSSSGKSPVKSPRKTPLKKFRTMDKELERTIALQQLREEFPTTRKRLRTSKKVNHIPFLASTVLEKALTSPEVTTALKPGPPRRRPCYLPENVSSTKVESDLEVGNKSLSEKTQSKVKKVKSKNDKEPLGDTNAEAKINFPEPGLESSTKSLTTAVVKTYSVKRKSTDTENDLKSTIAAVRKALNESAEEAIEFKPKKQKTVTKLEKRKKNKVLVKEKKQKVGAGSDKKRNLELEKLLGDEGAVRMLYDTQQAGAGATNTKKPKFKTTTGLKKDLVLKTKLVKNAVMRLSGVGTEGVSLRGKRHLAKVKLEGPKEEEPLFSSTPNIVLYKPKKKQRAEASRILYRHSSSESFDSGEENRRLSFEADNLNALQNAEPVYNGEKSDFSSSIEAETEKVNAKKSEILIKKKLKKIQRAKELKQGKVFSKKDRTERMSTESSRETKLNLSNVPVRKSSRPRTVSKKYSIWSSTSMDSLSVESLGLKKLKKASTELGKKLNVKELIILQYEHLVQVVLAPSSTLLKNSLHFGVFQELLQVFNYLAEENSCKVVLLSSQGNTFCQGVDINQIISLNDNERQSKVSQFVKAIGEFIMCLAYFKKPIIAGVQGAAVGLGVTLLPYCDLVISSDKASYYTPYVKIGQAPEGAPTHTFPRINRHLVSELLYKSHKMTAAEALKYGLVTEVIPEERFEEDLIMIARNMAARPVQGTQSIRFLLKNTELDKVKEILGAESELLEEHWTSSECINNMVRFLNSGELQLKPLENT